MRQNQEQIIEEEVSAEPRVAIVEEIVCYDPTIEGRLDNTINMYGYDVRMSSSAYLMRGERADHVGRVHILNQLVNSMRPARLNNLAAWRANIAKETIVELAASRSEEGNLIRNIVTPLVKHSSSSTSQGEQKQGRLAGLMRRL